MSRKSQAELQRFPNMAGPRQRFAFDSKYDFSHRPESYWPNTPNEETTLAKVKGTARRDLARHALEEGKDTPIGEIDIDLAFTPSLSDVERTEWGRIHPALMGGEFLPDPREDEVEVARVELQSTTGDVIQVLARRSPPGSKRPRIHHDEGQDEESLRDFFRVSSAFYPELAAYYDDRAEDWFLSVRLEWLEDEFETAQRSAARSPRIAGDPPARDGWALLREGSIDEAERLFIEAHDDTDALLGLAAVAKERGDRNLALSLLRPVEQPVTPWTSCADPGADPHTVIGALCRLTEQQKSP